MALLGTIVLICLCDLEADSAKNVFEGKNVCSGGCQ